MNIAFSTEWFLTIPGILITCGVILLIIALIMFIVGSSKGKKTSNIEQAMPEVNNVVEPQVEATPVIAPSSPVEQVQPTINESMIFNSETVAVSEPLGPIPEVSNAPVIPEVPLINAEPVITEVVQPVDESMNIPEVPVINTEVIPEITEPVLEMPEATNLEATSVNIYGGVVPTVEVNPVEPEKETRPIYGGADPLEATQNLPKIDVHHEPYSGGTQPVPEVTPVIPTPVEITPIPEVVVPEVVTPSVQESVNDVQPTVVPTPNVVQIPDVEQL